MSQPSITASSAGAFARLRAALASALHGVLPFAAILSVQLVVSILVSRAQGESGVIIPSPSANTIPFVAICLFFGAAFVAIYRMVRFTRPESPIHELGRQLGGLFFDAHRMSAGAFTLLLFVPFMAMFAEIKVSIPTVAPFAWDATLTAWDRALFFGYLPYELLQPIVGYPVVTFAFDIAYKLWFLILWLSFLGFAFTRSVPVLRTRFLVGFFLTWFLLGNLLAIALTSAGPCFYGLLMAGPDPYEPLMTYLREADRVLPIGALEIQGRLWSGYLGQSEAMGISAAPSLHNATSLLMALTAWKLDRRLGIALSAFAATTFVASISLGWHYAIDGLIAYAGTAVIWIACGRFATWWEGLRPGEGRSAGRGDRTGGRSGLGFA